jgi:hypothetical protein
LTTAQLALETLSNLTGRETSSLSENVYSEGQKSTHPRDLRITVVLFYLFLLADGSPLQLERRQLAKDHVLAPLWGREVDRIRQALIHVAATAPTPLYRLEILLEGDAQNQPQPAAVRAKVFTALGLLALADVTPVVFSVRLDHMNHPTGLWTQCNWWGWDAGAPPLSGDGKPRGLVTEKRHASDEVGTAAVNLRIPPVWVLGDDGVSEWASLLKVWHRTPATLASQRFTRALEYFHRGLSSYNRENEFNALISWGIALDLLLAASRADPAPQPKRRERLSALLGQPASTYEEWFEARNTAVHEAAEPSPRIVREIGLGLRGALIAMAPLIHDCGNHELALAHIDAGKQVRASSI